MKPHIIAATIIVVATLVFVYHRVTKDAEELNVHMQEVVDGTTTPPDSYPDDQILQDKG